MPTKIPGVATWPVSAAILERFDLITGYFVLEHGMEIGVVSRRRQVVPAWWVNDFQYGEDFKLLLSLMTGHRTRVDLMRKWHRITSGGRDQ